MSQVRARLAAAGRNTASVPGLQNGMGNATAEAEQERGKAVRNMQWTEAVEKADALKSVGDTVVYIERSTRIRAYPWQYVTKVEPGGSHRLDISTNVNVEAAHPCGLTFCWFIDIESRGANGNSHYQIDTETMTQVLGLLPIGPRQQFQSYLTECAAAIEKRSGEEWEYLQKQFRDAALLRALGDAKPGVKP